ncbi:helix-turn-helix domain-containing protein [Fangia hongkongensis]|uniref:helix-turn-helix domain-containing protein n=1 Tax=Fangia hongkongensis TaxID=270495 RepID=UPI000375B77D|nr:helix-turn-helix domain-containing protein [Fangia hongkongensis]MBK2125740.1 helix-turn-helix domain-containing protein [Fangia hongkongensis]
MIAINEINKSWSLLMPYIEAYKTKKQYEMSKKLLQELMKLNKEAKTEEIISFAKALAKQIANYERRKLDIADDADAKEVLGYLIKVHNLAQKDLPEIGSQSLVSKILKGERSLTTDHIKALSARFNVSIETWF